MGKSAALLKTERAIETAPVRIAQAGALVWRPGQYGPGIEVLLITSLGTGRWIIPKGWQKPGKSLAESAAEEAFEEAGIRGTLAIDSIGAYDYEKTDKGKPRAFSVSIFEMRLTESLSVYPERDRRRRLWIDPAKAAELVDERGLRNVLRTFEPALA